MPTLTFTTGNDSYEVNAAGSFDLTFLAGDDTLTLRHASATTTATMGDGADVVSHRLGTANVNGGNGSDRFEVYNSGLTADGAADADLINVRGGHSLVLSGGLGNDRFNFYNGTSGLAMYGNDGADDFFGYGQAVYGAIYGGPGNDYFVTFSSDLAPTGTLMLYGGTGNDIYRYHLNTSAAFGESVGEGTDSVQVARGQDYTLPDNIENISVSGFSGSTANPAWLTGNDLGNTIIAHNNVDTVQAWAGNDRVFGKGGNDVLWGSDGNDYLDGGDGNDQLSGDFGNDTLQGRAGDDDLTGMQGNDTFYVDSIGDEVYESPGEGTDLVRVGVTGYSMAFNVENAILIGTGGYTMWGNPSDNDITGNSGDNILTGMGGNDFVRGGAGSDFLYGYDGNDTLVGGDGQDGLAGELGADDLTGGAGPDFFWILSLTHSTPGAPDEIMDFHSVTGEFGDDQLDLSNVDADSTLAGDQAFSVPGVAPSGSPGSLWYDSEINPSGLMDITFYGDVNGDGIADLQILIHSTTSSFQFEDITR